MENRIALKTGSTSLLIQLRNNTANIAKTSTYFGGVFNLSEVIIYEIVNMNYKNTKVDNSTRKISVSTLFFFLTTVILAVLLLMNNYENKKERGYDSSSVMSRITYMQELALIKHNYTGVISYKDYMKILNINVPLTDKYFLLKYNGYIKAGVDFDRIKVDVKNDSTVHVSIPQPKILETVIDEKSVEVFNESENAFNPIKISDYNEALSREKNVMIRDAIQQGIYAEATDQAKMAITSLLREMGFSQIHITEELVTPQRR